MSVLSVDSSMKKDVEVGQREGARGSSDINFEGGDTLE
jgi:hypothetical protein